MEKHLAVWAPRFLAAFGRGGSDNEHLRADAAFLGLQMPSL